MALMSTLLSNSSDALERAHFAQVIYSARLSATSASPSNFTSSPITIIPVTQPHHMSKADAIRIGDALFVIADPHYGYSYRVF